MIARLTGILAETAADHAVIDVAGVGYAVLASTRTLDAIGPVGSAVLLLTELQVREDSMTLFAFANSAERESFRHLTSVQGVGGRVALAILSVLDPTALATAVAHGDKAMVARALLTDEFVEGLGAKRGVDVLGLAFRSSDAGGVSAHWAALRNSSLVKPDCRMIPARVPDFNSRCRGTTHPVPARRMIT